MFSVQRDELEFFQLGRGCNGGVDECNCVRAAKLPDIFAGQFGVAMSKVDGRQAAQKCLNIFFLF